MFNNTFKFMLVLSTLVLAGFVTANAQIDEGMALRIDVPHSFVVNNKELPAGRYVITTVDQTSGGSNLLELKQLDGKQAVVFDTIYKTLGGPSHQTELLFDQSGDQYFLKEIRLRGDDQSDKLLPTRSEKMSMAAAASVN